MQDNSGAFRMNYCYEFGHFLLSPTEPILLRDGVDTGLHEKAVAALAYLIETSLKDSQHFVSIEELLSAVWRLAAPGPPGSTLPSGRSG